MREGNGTGNNVNRGVDYRISKCDKEAYVYLKYDFRLFLYLKNAW